MACKSRETPFAPRFVCAPPGRDPTLTRKATVRVSGACSCDHNNFAVVGMAVPDRINLFRAQASRAVGGNGRRTSHNPPDPTMLSIYDRVGIVVMDENRLFDNNTHYVDNMGALVKRDRNHVRHRTALSGMPVLPDLVAPWTRPQWPQCHQCHQTQQLAWSEWVGHSPSSFGPQPAAVGGHLELLQRR